MIDLPTCSATAARALSVLAQRLPAEFAIAGHAVVATLPIGDHLPCPADWVRVGARLASHQAILSLDPALLPAESIAHWPEITSVGVAGPLRDILRDLLLDNIAQAIMQIAGEAPRWLAEPPDRELPYTVMLLRSDSMVPVAAVDFDESGLTWAAARCAGLPCHSVAIDALVLPLDLVIDRIIMNRNELAGLAPRDVVLLDQSPVDADGIMTAVLCRPGFPGFRVRVAGGRASVDSPVDAAMDTPTPPPAGSIDDLPLVIDCDVGRISLTIAQLRELSAGQVLDLGLDATRRVSLRLNGQVIATGELVRVAERTGVRITDLLLSRVT